MLSCTIGDRNCTIDDVKRTIGDGNCTIGDGEVFLQEMRRLDRTNPSEGYRMANRDYLPRSDAEFLAWMNTFLSALNANLATFGALGV
jgi:hypothetical protein